jgi:uncharacterized protein
MMLPMIGQMGSFARPSADLGDVLDLYLHGSVGARLMRMGREAGGGEGMPVTVAASHVDGLVLALTPNSHSYNYRSAVLFGYATAVTDVAEKLWAMELVTEGVVPGRWEGTRVPPNGAEMQSTTILRVRISSGSAKVRTGGPHDEAYDTGDEAVVGRVWTGVVPVHLTFGEPVAGPYNRLEVPGYLAEYRKDSNEAAEEYSVAATVEPESKKKKSHEDED